jgi:hypothetical protein
MRITIWSLAFMLACGNQATPASTTPTATASVAPPPTATASTAASSAPSETATASAAPTASAPPTPQKKIGEVLANAKTIHLTWRPKLDSNDAKLLDITTPQAIKQIVEAIGPDQTPQGEGPSYMATFTLKFVDQGQNPLATISLFASTTMSDSNKKYGRINVADGTYGGITVAKYEDLQKKLKPLGVDLP